MATLPARRRTIESSTRFRAAALLGALAVVLAAGGRAPVFADYTAAEKDAHADKLREFTAACANTVHKGAKLPITLPGILPDQEHCKGHSQSSAVCGAIRDEDGDLVRRGWQFIHEFKAVGSATAKEEDAKELTLFQKEGTAQLYEWEFNKTVCWYLYRGAAAGGDGNGTLCFNKKGQVCALDVDNSDVKKEPRRCRGGAAGRDCSGKPFGPACKCTDDADCSSKECVGEGRARPIWEDLRGANELKFLKDGKLNQSCWLCHNSGTLAPKDFYYEKLDVGDRHRLLGINRGWPANDSGGYPGVHWIDASNDWKSSTLWVRDVRVEARKGCSRNGCHTTDFIQTGNKCKGDLTLCGGKSTLALGSSPYCRIVAYPAFHTSGSMEHKSFAETELKSGKKETAEEACANFSREMGCTPGDFNCSCNNANGPCKGKTFGGECDKASGGKGRCMDKADATTATTGAACDCR